MQATTFGRQTTAVFLLLAVALLPANGWAQMRPGAGVLTPLAGVYVFDGDQDIDHDPVYGLALGHVIDPTWTIEGVFNFIDTRFDDGSGEINVYNYRLDGLYHFMEDSQLVPYVAAGLGLITFEPDDGDSETDPLFNYGGGVKFFLTDSLALRGDIRHIVSWNDVENNVVATLGLQLLMGGEEVAAEETAPSDSDGDGVIDYLDECPGTPAGTTVGENGCPPDSDGDGVTDDRDKCPGTPAGVKVGADGCPADSDGDGVTDDRDKCPKTPKGVAVNKDGCPADSDGDGVPDQRDKCPGTPAGTTVSADGCPADSDRDGVIDDRDRCPDTPTGAKVDERGCWVLRGVNFDSGKATLKSGSGAILDEVLAVLMTNEELKVEVQGHTDSSGPAALNQRLSEARAKAVKAYFVTNGIDADRLTVRGFGPSVPAATNDTKEGRAVNRRVELQPLR